jgi:hypothetical protein
LQPDEIKTKIIVSGAATVNEKIIGIPGKDETL